MYFSACIGDLHKGFHLRKKHIVSPKKYLHFCFINGIIGKHKKERLSWCRLRSIFALMRMRRASTQILSLFVNMPALKNIEKLNSTV